MSSLQLPKSLVSRLQCLEFLTPQWREFLLGHGKLLKVHKSTILFNQGEPAEYFYIILSGGIKLFKKPTEVQDSDYTIIDILTPGDLVAAALMRKASETICYPVTAKAMASTELLKLSRKFFQEHWMANVALMDYSNQQILKRIEHMQADRSSQRLSLPQRAARFLCEKVSPFQGLKFTRKDIASCIGASNEAVIRLLSEWTEKGWISTYEQEISILDFDQLKSIWQNSK